MLLTIFIKHIFFYYWASHITFVFVLSKQQQEPLGDSHGHLQQFDQHDLLNPNMLNSYQEPVVSTTVSYRFHFLFRLSVFFFNIYIHEPDRV